MAQYNNTFEDTDIPVSPRTSRNPLDGPIARIAQRFGGSRAKDLERFIKFAIVGISGAVIDLGLVYLLQATVLPPNPNLNGRLDLNVALATAIGFFTAVISNFIWTRLWVYPDSRSRSARRQLAMFTLISVTGGVCRTAWVTLTHSFFGQLVLPMVIPLLQILRPGYIPGPVASEKVGTIASQMIAMVVVMLWNFFANRLWTYNDVE